MAMTQRDFEAIAEAVADAKRKVTYAWQDGTVPQAAALSALETVAEELATASAQRYRGGYGFKRSKFMEAAGFPDA